MRRVGAGNSAHDTPIIHNPTRTHRGPPHLSSTCWPGLSLLTLPAMTSDYDFESSDILGGALPVGRGRVVQNSGFSAFFKVCALGASTLFLLLAFRHGRTFFLRWKERHYKLYVYNTSMSFRVLTQVGFQKIYASTVRNSGPRPATLQCRICCC
jgi:hypothetical protein